MLNNVAIAAPCDRWKIALEDAEGGKQWTASVCAIGGQCNSMILMICHRSRFNVRYLPAVDGDFINQKREFSFQSGNEQHGLMLAYEALDGAFAATVSQDSNIIRLIRSGDRLTIADPARKVAATRFSLKGSSTALGQLVQKCGR